MTNFEELSLNELERISGGAAITTGSDQSAGIWRKFESIGVAKANDSLPNGTTVTVVGSPRFNEVKGRNYVQIEYTKKGKTRQGWVAASIVGLKR